MLATLGFRHRDTPFWKTTQEIPQTLRINARLLFCLVISPMHGLISFLVEKYCTLTKWIELI